jgi:hypothetical protein
MKILLFLFLLMLFAGSLYSQNRITYAYDAAGNRTERVIVPAAKSAMVPAETFFTDELAGRLLKIYPNPTDGHLKIEIGNTEGIKSCTITIVTMGGKQVMKKPAVLPLTDIDISNQPSGTYVMLIDIDGEKTTWKIIKK